MKKISIAAVLSVLLLSIGLSCVSDAHAASAIRNGSFASGLTSWNINPAISPSWDPLVTDGVTGNVSVNLHPPTEGFSGTVIYQNLNVTGIANKSFHLSFKATQNYAPPGNTLSVYITYVDASNVVTREKVLNPDNASITMDTPLSADYTFPGTARKLVKIEFSKENYGSFNIDDVSLTAAGITVGGIPVITSITDTGAGFGSKVSIAGTGFGAAKNSVTVGGSTAGITVKSWTYSKIQIKVSDPARSGKVCVTNDFVESDINTTLEVKSPNYSVSIPSGQQTVIKGQTAEFFVKVDFNKGFTTTTGITFSIDGNADVAPLAVFTPVPLKDAGGVLLQINTSSLPAGTYTGFVKSRDGSLLPRSTAFTLEVITVTGIRFYELDADMNPVTITSKNITTQGYFSVGIEAMGSNGETLDLNGLTMTSSNPSALGVYKRLFGYEYYALGNGQAKLTATSPDGTKAQLTVNMSLGFPKITSLSVPTQVSCISAGDLFFSAVASDALSMVGYDSSGMMNFSSDFLDNIIWGGDLKSAQSTFHLTGTPSDLGTVLFYAQTGSSTRYAPLTIVNDPSTAEVKGGVTVLDDTFAEVFTLDFFDVNNTLVDSREIFLMHMNKEFDLGGIPPGTYKLRLSTPGELSPVEPQWYPNAAGFGKAKAVTFTAGQTVSNIYFFVQGKLPAGPDIYVSPVSGVFGKVAAGSVSGPKKFTIYNRGSASLALTGVTISGTNSSMFNLTSHCAATLGAGKSCTVDASFAPSATGAKTGYIHIESNDADAPVLDVPLSGTGT